MTRTNQRLPGVIRTVSNFVCALVAVILILALCAILETCSDDDRPIDRAPYIGMIANSKK
jgi:hypothetical protein